MYFWKINDLKKQIILRGLSETQVFYYILLYVGTTTILIQMMEYFPSDELHNKWDYVKCGLDLLIPIFGTILAYRANGGETGTSFAAKYFSISFVVGIRFFVYYIPVMSALIAYHYWGFIESGAEIQNDWILVALSSAWYGAVYAFIAKHIRDTVKSKDIVTK